MSSIESAAYGSGDPLSTRAVDDSASEDAEDGEGESVDRSLVTAVRNGGGVDEGVYGLYRRTLEVESVCEYGVCGGRNGGSMGPSSRAVDLSASLMLWTSSTSPCFCSPDMDRGWTSFSDSSSDPACIHPFPLFPPFFDLFFSSVVAPIPNMQPTFRASDTGGMEEEEYVNEEDSACVCSRRR